MGTGTGLDTKRASQTWEEPSRALIRSTLTTLDSSDNRRAEMKNISIIESHTGEAVCLISDGDLGLGQGPFGDCDCGE